ncbi:MAG: VanZ family protein [Pyrinomonadaceae bacterium]
MPNINFNSKWREYLWYYAPLILWIVIIFVASSNTGSMANTSRIIRPLLLWLVPDISEISLLIVHGYIRKLAHFVFYFILGFLAARALVSTSKTYLRKFWILAALALVIIVAVLDETNQSFLASRTSSIYDVLLDTVGGLTAIIICFVGTKLRKPFYQR